MKNKLMLILFAFVLAAFGKAQNYYSGSSDIYQDTVGKNLILDSLFHNQSGIEFKFKAVSKMQIDTFLTKIMSIDNFNSSTYEVIAYANRSQFKEFLKLNYPYQVIPKLITKAITMATTTAEMASWDRYPTYSVYDQMMTNFQTNYPNLFKRYDLLTLPSGLKLIIGKITSDVNTNAAKPKFFWMSSMHGDEITGYVTMLRYINYLLSNYGTNSRVTNILDGMELWILPDVNPDGTYYNSVPLGSTVANAQRGNANGVDLNRNFPNPVDGAHPDGYSYQPETQAMMNFADTLQFVMSAGFHGGAEVVNFPWDTWTSAERTTADHLWWRMISKDFADTCYKYGILNSLSNYFHVEYETGDYGFTEGGDWYVITGGSQDYMNYYKHCREITLEVSITKMPGSELMPNYWNALSPSILYYTEECLYGIKGTITDACTGQPLQAKVFINSHDVDSSWVWSGSDFGDYYRPIKAGTWSITYSRTGYTSQTISVTATDGACTIQNVALVPTSPPYTAGVSITGSPSGTMCPGTNYSFTATATNGGSVPAYQWKKGGANITGETNSTFTSSALVNGDAITCEMTSDLGAQCVSGSPATSNSITISTLYSATPNISNIVRTPGSVSSNNTVSVSADVIDCESGISNVILKWCTDGTSFDNSISMSLGTAPTYTAISNIPAQAVGTTVSYKIEATDELLNTTISAVESYTVSNEPTNHATSFTCGTPLINTIPLTWIDAAGGIIPTGYLIKGCSGVSCSITNPVNSIQESNSTLVQNVSPGVESVTFSGLTANTSYTFKIYPYTGSGTGIVYKTSGTVPGTTCSTTNTLSTVATWTFPVGSNNATADGGVTGNLSKNITTVGGASSPIYTNAGAGTPTDYCASATTWGTGSGVKYWEIEFSATGFSGLKLSSKQYSQDKGPEDFKAQYKIGAGGTYTDITGATAIVLQTNWTSGVISNISLSSACENQSSLYLRWIMTTDDNVGTGSINAASYSGIDDIIITGTPVLPSAAGTISGTSTVCIGTTGVTYSVGAITGASGYTWILPDGASIASGTGTNSITVDFSGSAVSGDISVYGTNINGDGLPSSFAVSVDCDITWKGVISADWLTGANWSTGSVPGSSDDVYISPLPSFQPHITSSPLSPALCKNLNILAGATLTIDAGKALTASGSTTVSGTFTIESDASGTGSFIDNGTINGNVTVKKYLTKNRWWYIGLPLSTTINASCFGTISTVLNTDAHLYYWNEPGHAYVNIPNGSTTLDPVTYPLRGYSIKEFTNDINAVFTGLLNTGTIGGSANLTYTTGVSQGFNLVCNPYPSAINWGSEYTPTSGLTQTNLGTTIWYRSGGQFSTYNWMADGTGANGGERYIPAMQAFWVRTAGSTGGLQLTNATRLHNSTTFYKENLESNVFRISVSDLNTSDEAVVAFYTYAITGDDLYDSEKMFVTDEDIPQLYSLTGDNTEVAINGQNEITFGDERVVPLGFSTGVSGTFTLQATNLDEFDPSIEVYLEDQLTGNLQDLRSNNMYSFSSAVVDNAARFVLHFGGITTGISSSEESNVLIYAFGGALYINAPDDCTAEIFNVLGEKIIQMQLFSGLNKIPVNVIDGIYIVKIYSGTNAQTKEIFLKAENIN